MSRIIATDEAGYGPRLGPLVVAASVWDVEGAQSGVAERVFPALVDGIPLSAGTRLAIQDSKQVFRRNHPDGLAPLERSIAAFVRMSHAVGEGQGDAPATLEELIHALAPGDVGSLLGQPWFRQLDGAFPFCDGVAESATAAGEEARAILCGSGITYVAAAARILDSADFNILCLQMGNKATVLSETTVQLVRHCIDSYSGSEYVEVFSDRHGGRHRYASLLQKFFPDSMPQIVHEDAAESRYRIMHGSMRVDWRFTVKGDRFPPVALSSMFAKYLRERLMEKVNAFWADHHGRTLAPTAGYSTDATRFCREIAATAKRLGISNDRYIRAR